MPRERDISELQAKLGLGSSKIPDLGLALTHGSVNNTGGPRVKNHEALGFLGDAVIELAVRNRLFHDYPGESKGNLTVWAHDATNNEALAKRARQPDLAIAGYIDVGNGAEEEKHVESVLATTFEAVIGSIFLAQGLQAASDCALRLLKPGPRANMAETETAGRL